MTPESLCAMSYEDITQLLWELNAVQSAVFRPAIDLIEAELERRARGPQ